jgi:hypothetical protein
MEGRAIRRAHKVRLKKARKNWWGHDPLSEKLIGLAIDTPATCSCWMCGNPRKHFGERTIQERRQMQDID